MALPMVHLYAARAWAEEFPQFRDQPEYYLGSISPDAVHARDGSDKSHKSEVHLNNWRSSNPDRVVEYWKERHTPFDIGYGVHVLLDGHWAEEFKARFPEILQPDGKIRADIYYNDTYHADYELRYRDSSMDYFREMLMKAQAPEDHPFMTREHFENWRAFTLNFHSKEPEDRPVQFITMEYVQSFIDHCTRYFTPVYQQYLKEAEL